MWEHEWNSLLKDDKNVRSFVELHPKSSELKIRNCLFGGRTNAIKLYHKCQPDEYISYIDVTSLYPFVQKYKKFPIGLPVILNSDL